MTTHRRAFLQSSLATLPALSYAAAADKPTEKVVVAVLGVRGRGRDLIRLTATESMLMRLLAARPHEPVSRQELVEDLGGGVAEAQERAIDVQMTRLRRKIEDDPRAPRYLQTVRGSGYMLAPD